MTDNTPVLVTKTSMLMDPERFQHAQHVASMLANSALFPAHLRQGNKEQAVANAVLVLDMADRMNENPLTVAQNIYFVSGKPGWMTTYMIARANQSEAFSDQIDWRVSGKGENLAVTAFATLSKTGREVKITCDMAMAKAEGWTSNKKYQSMPETMLRYRSATMLIRMYCPEVMIGMPTQIDMELGTEIRDVTPPAPAIEPEDEKPPKDISADAPDVEDAEEVAAEDAGVEAPANQPDLEQFKRLADQIINDLTDATDADEVLDMYAPELEKMQSLTPNHHKRVLEAAGVETAA